MCVRCFKALTLKLTDALQYIKCSRVGDNMAIIKPSPLLHHQPFFKSCSQGLISVVSIPDPRPLHPRATLGVYDLAYRLADGLVSSSLGWISVQARKCLVCMCRGFLARGPLQENPADEVIQSHNPLRCKSLICFQLLRLPECLCESSCCIIHA